MDDIRKNVVSLLSGEYCANNIKTTHFTQFVECSMHLQAFRSQNISDVLKKVNSLVNKSSSRLEGLLLLHHVLEQSDTNIFLEHAKSWANSLCHILQSFNEDVVHQLAAVVLSRVLQDVAVFSELSRDIATSLIPSLIPTLLSAHNQWHVAALRCLYSCLLHFRGPCGPFKNKIEAKLVTSLLKAKPQSEELTVICRCLPLLAVCGGGRAKGSKVTEGWSCYLDKMVGSVHRVLDALYMDLETETYDRPELTLFTPETLEKEPDRIYTLLHHYTVLCHGLVHIITPGIPLTLPVPVEDILAVVCRALAISPKFLLSRPTHQRMLLCSVLPSIHQVSLLLLKHTITCVGGGLVPQAGLINKLISQVLTAFSADTQLSNNQHKPFSEVRCSVYDVLTTWLVILGASTDIANIAPSLVSHILTDARPSHHTVKTGSSKLLSGADTIFSGRKQKKKVLSVDGAGFSWQQKSDDKANWKLCSVALKALENIIMYCGTMLKPAQHKAVQEFILPVILSVCEQCNPAPVPYGVPDCRRGLYAVLQACVLVPSPSWPPPTHMALGLLSKASMAEHNVELRQYCHQLLVVCQSVIHPRVPPLVAPQTVSEILHVKKQLQTDAQKAAETELTTQAQYPAPRVSDTFNMDGATVSGSHQGEVVSVSYPGEREVVYVELDASDDSEDVEMTEGREDDTLADEGEAEEANENEEAEEDADDTSDLDDSDDDCHELIQVSSDNVDNESSNDTGDKDMKHSSVEQEIQQNVEPCEPDSTQPSTSHVVDRVEGITGATTNGVDVSTCTSSIQHEGQGDVSGSGVKRKHDDTESNIPAEAEPDRKKQVDDTDLMLQSFVDDGPDPE